MKKLLFLALGISVFVFAVAAFGEIYKWTDEEGNIHYSNTPPKQKKAQEIEIRPTFQPKPKSTLEQVEESKRLQPTPPHKYTNSTYRWSISYPSNWTVDDKNPAFVRILSSADNALCGIHTVSVRSKSLDEFTDLMLAQTEQFLKQKGLVSVILSRRRISLPNDIAGYDVLVDILPGGRSRRIFVLADGQAYALDCETYAKNWEKFEPFFKRIINSFTLGE